MRLVGLNRSRRLRCLICFRRHGVRGLARRGLGIGVVADARQAQLQDTPEPTIFLSNSQAPMYFATLVVRAAGDPGPIARSAEAAIHRVDPEQAVSDIKTMETVFSDSVSSPRFQAVLLMMFAGLAVALATIGVYGVVSYSISQRANEIGIRIALGARSANVVRLVLREALTLAAIALLLGLAGALAPVPAQSITCDCKYPGAK